MQVDSHVCLLLASPETLNWSRLYCRQHSSDGVAHACGGVDLRLPSRATAPFEKLLGCPDAFITCGNVSEESSVLRGLVSSATVT